LSVVETKRYTEPFDYAQEPRSRNPASISIGDIQDFSEQPGFCP